MFVLAIVEANLIDRIRRTQFITWKHFGHTGLSISFNPGIGFFMVFGDGTWFSSWWANSGRIFIVVILRISYPHTTSERFSDNATTWEKMVAFRTYEETTILDVEDITL